MPEPMKQIADAIKHVRESVPKVLSGTISGTQTSSVTGTAQVVLDNDPGGKAVSATSLGNASLQTGDRVLCLRYPPRGLLILGPLDWPTATLLAGRLRLSAANDASLTSTEHALQIGPTTGSNLRADGNEIMSVNNGAIDRLELNAEGGTVRIGVNAGALVPSSLFVPAMTAGSSFDASTRTTASTTYVTGSLTANVAVKSPESGVIVVSISSRVATVTAAVAAGDAAVISFEVRDGSAVGTLLLAASDDNGAIGTRLAAGSTRLTHSRTVAVTPGVAATGIYFVRAMMRTNNAANSAECAQTMLTVQASI